MAVPEVESVEGLPPAVALHVAGNDALELRSGLRVVGDHLTGEGLSVGCLSAARSLGLDFEHVAHRGFLDDVFRFRRDAEGELTPVLFPVSCADAAVERKALNEMLEQSGPGSRATVRSQGRRVIWLRPL